jgi:hypothetical protein
MSKSELMQAETGGRGGINPGMGVYRADGTEIRLGDPDYNPYDYITAKQPAAAPPPVAVAPPPAIQGGASPKQPTIFNPAAFRPAKYEIHVMASEVPKNVANPSLYKKAKSKSQTPSLTFIRAHTLKRLDGSGVQAYGRQIQRRYWRRSDA